MKHLKVTVYGLDNDANEVVVGAISFNGSKLKATKELRFTVAEPIRIGSDTIDPKKEPERFLRSMHLVYRSAYFSASKAD